MWCCTLSRRSAWTSVCRPPTPPPSPWTAPAVLYSAGWSCTQLPTPTGEPPYPQCLHRPATPRGWADGTRSAQTRGAGCRSSTGHSRRWGRSPWHLHRRSRGRPPSSCWTCIWPLPPSRRQPLSPPCRRWSSCTEGRPCNRPPAQRTWQWERYVFPSSGPWTSPALAR